MNGIINIGFNTIGKPNIIGSLIPKIPGTIDNLPNWVILLDLQNNNITITSESVLPPPPNVVKKSVNGPVNIFGNGKPACKASKFSIVNTFNIGENTVFATAGPLIPKNQNDEQANE